MVDFELDVDWPRAVWVGFGVALGVVVLWVLQSFVGTFVFALFIYYSTRRVNAELQDRVGQPTVSAALALVAIALPAVLLLIYATAIGLQELQEFSDTTDLGPALDVARPYLNVTEAVENPQGLVGDADVFGLVRESLGRTTAYLGLVGTGLLHLFVMFALAFYLLRDDDRLAAWVRDLGARGGTVETYAVAVDRSLERIFAGNILNAVVTGSVGAITYSLLNFAATDPVAVPYPALLGLLAGVGSLIPVVGMKIVYVPVVGYLALRAWMAGTGWGFVGLFAVTSFVVVDAIPDLVVRPYVSGGDLHTGSLMFAYILGPLLFGWYGLFLGPVVLVFVTHFARIVVPDLLADGEARPTGVDPTHLTEPASGPPRPSSGDPVHEPSVAGDASGSAGNPADPVADQAPEPHDGATDESDGGDRERDGPEN